MLVVSFYQSEIPSAPGRPEPSDVTETSVTLTWTPPSSDGGSPITGYVLEKKEDFMTRWVRVTRDSTRQTTLTLNDLKEGSEYSFRVIAENKAGQSQPSEPCRPVKAKKPYGKSLQKRTKN